ncbi:MAG: hypothetical protein HUN04_22580 [Desulfobacter sp.]|nr:MAG: hypothetical protein HUN04_22580 [Desulfobacter sp.]
MNEIEDDDIAPREDPNRKMSREEIIKAVTEPGVEASTEKRFLVIPSLASEKVVLEEFLDGLGLAPDSKKYEILKAYCSEKTASLIDIKAMIQRIEHLTPEQLDVLEVICRRREFSAKRILDVIQSIKKTGTTKLLALRAFVDLDRVGPGPLNRFFSVILPQGSPQEMGREQYEQELREKAMRPDQVDAFYTLCTEVPAISHGNAISLLLRIRSFGLQHSRLISKFLKAGVCFGEKHITDDNIVGLVNLLQSLPELTDSERFNKMVKKMSRRPDNQKKDFQYLLQAFRDEVESEQRSASGIRSLFKG